MGLRIFITLGDFTKSIWDKGSEVYDSPSQGRRGGVEYHLYYRSFCSIV